MRDCKKFCWRKGSYTPIKPQPAPPQEHNYSLDYLTTEALEDGTIAFNIMPAITTDLLTSISYSKDNGETWTTTNNTNGRSSLLTIAVNVSLGDKVLWKGIGVRTADPESMQSSPSGSLFMSTCNFNVYGNIMSLLYGDNFTNITDLNTNNNVFAGLFAVQMLNLLAGTSYSCNVVDASNLILPANILTYGCYMFMFYGCTSLIIAPELPATALAEDCYYGMFDGCESLTSAPKILPATTLANECYMGMFRGCISLKTAPELPATTLAIYCYEYMFYGCTSLTVAPKLPATTLANSCYKSMFEGCTSLITAPELPATTLADTCYQSMFEGCTSLTTVPGLPATTLASNCCDSMFCNCTSLTTAPELPATTLANSCYQNMFLGCSSLNYIKCLATDISASDCTYNWVYSVSSIGTFVKTDSMTSWATGSVGIPSGWTVQDA